MRAGWCFELRIFQRSEMYWLMAFRGSLVKRLIRYCLPFTHMFIGRRHVWGRVVGRLVRESCRPLIDGRSGSFDQRHL